MVLEKTLESPLDCKEIQPVHPKGNQSSVFIERTDVEAETPIVWPPDTKSSGPIVAEDGKLVDKHLGYHPRLGYTSRSALYDVIGYVDKEAEKWYASWINKNNQADIVDNIQNVDIYNGLYDVVDDANSQHYHLKVNGELTKKEVF